MMVARARTLHASIPTSSLRLGVRTDSSFPLLPLVIFLSVVTFLSRRPFQVIFSRFIPSKVGDRFLAKFKFANLNVTSRNKFDPPARPDSVLLWAPGNFCETAIVTLVKLLSLPKQNQLPGYWRRYYAVSATPPNLMYDNMEIYWSKIIEFMLG